MSQNSVYLFEGGGGSLMMTGMRTISRGSSVGGSRIVEITPVRKNCLDIWQVRGS